MILMPKVTLIILVVGLIIAVYLVQQRTNLLPKAYTPQPTKVSQYLSDKAIHLSERFPEGAYVTLCRRDGTDVEGVWQVHQNQEAANFMYNQENVRCDGSAPNYLTFTQGVPVGTYLYLCSSLYDNTRILWKVNESGRVADFVESQADPFCTP